MEEPKVLLRLGDWTEHCEHTGTAAGLPRVWATVREDAAGGWGSVAFHWTGASWGTCVPVDWETGAPPSPGVLVAWTESARQAVETIPVQRWRCAYRAGLVDSLQAARARVAWGDERAGALRVRVRQLECALAAADLDDPEVCAVAHRMLCDWAGSAEDLLMVAHAVGGASDATR